MANLTINGKTINVDVEDDTPLLWAIRENVGLTGTKYGCGIAQCGACTVHVDGVAMRSCGVPVSEAVGKQITTVEGLGTPENLSAVQAAFVEKDAMMCGFCTSGFVTTVTGLLNENPNPTLEEVREGCKGNFCRCGTFPHVFQAALTAAVNLKGHG